MSSEFAALAKPRAEFVPPGIAITWPPPARAFKLTAVLVSSAISFIWFKSTNKFSLASETSAASAALAASAAGTPSIT